MTVREFVQTILLEAPDLDAEIYVSKPIDDIESKSYTITEIDSKGNNDSLIIYLEDYI
jgi:hypothetical protein